MGVNNAFELFSKSVILKHPHLKDKLTYSFMRKLFMNFTSVALDYPLQLAHFQSSFATVSNEGVYRNKISEENKQFVEQIEYVSGVEIDFDSVVEVPE